jgi:hypothetical protein
MNLFSSNLPEQRVKIICSRRRPSRVHVVIVVVVIIVVVIVIVVVVVIVVVEVDVDGDRDDGDKDGYDEAEQAEGQFPSSSCLKGK